MKYLITYNWFDIPKTVMLDDFDDALDRAVTMSSLIEYKDVHLYSLSEVSLTAV